MANKKYSETANYVTRGWGQVEPNHMSAQRTGQIYAQLPAAASIDVLENGQYVKYDYANGVCDFDGVGEWMLVYNEVKVYRDGQSDADFAMIKDNYQARVYSPIDGETFKQITDSRNYGEVTETAWFDTNGREVPAGSAEASTSAVVVRARKVTAPADPYEIDATETPFGAQYDYAGPKKMPASTAMVPRVFKTNVGDIYTTNCFIASTTQVDSTTVVVKPTVGEYLSPNTAGYLQITSDTSVDMLWQVVKNYDLGDRQPAVKIMRVK